MNKKYLFLIAVLCVSSDGTWKHLQQTLIVDFAVFGIRLPYNHVNFK